MTPHRDAALPSSLDPVRPDPGAARVEGDGRALSAQPKATLFPGEVAEEERLRLAVEAAFLGTWEFDVRQGRVSWDVRMLRLHAVEAFGGTVEAWQALLDREGARRWGAELMASVEEGRPLDTILELPRTVGERLFLRVRGSVVRDADGNVVRLAGAAWDVSEEQRMRLALERAERVARDASAATTAKSEFLANMSHEIRTPLNAVIGMSGILLGTDLSREQREFAETIRLSGDGLLALINDILDYSKIESGKLELERSVFDLRDCVESALEVVAGKAAEKQLDVLCSFEAGVPEAVIGDETRVRQVLVNLLSNAVKFTARGEVFLSVAPAPLAAGPGRWRFAVHDSGIGIPADRMGRLFKTFSQVDASTTRQYGGTGLGLAISQSLVEAMGGAIRVESAEGRGSVFSFDLPLSEAPSAPKPFASGRVPGFLNRKVLVVDDNATVARVLCQQLVGWGIIPRAASSAAEARAILEQDASFDLVLADLDLPGTDGRAMAAELRRRRGLEDLPFVLLTWPGRAKPDPAAGISGCVSRPCKAAALFERLVEGLQRRKPAAVTSGVTGTEPPLAMRHPLRLLLTEDNSINQRVALLMLQRLGYTADVANNGREAVEAVASRTYDLVLMDVQMPEMDGHEATREIRRRVTAVRPRIVAMTANASTVDRERCLEAGMDDFITKPVRLPDLKQVLETTVALPA